MFSLLSFAIGALLFLSANAADNVPLSKRGTGTLTTYDYTQVDYELDTCNSVTNLNENSVAYTAFLSDSNTEVFLMQLGSDSNPRTIKKFGVSMTFANIGAPSNYTFGYFFENGTRVDVSYGSISENSTCAASGSIDAPILVDIEEPFALADQGVIRKPFFAVTLGTVNLVGNIWAQFKFETVQAWHEAPFQGLDARISTEPIDVTVTSITSLSAPSFKWTNLIHAETSVSGSDTVTVWRYNATDPETSFLRFGYSVEKVGGSCSSKFLAALYLDDVPYQLTFTINSASFIVSGLSQIDPSITVFNSTDGNYEFRITNLDSYDDPATADCDYYVHIVPEPNTPIHTDPLTAFVYMSGATHTCDQLYEAYQAPILDGATLASNIITIADDPSNPTGNVTFFDVDASRTGPVLKAVSYTVVAFDEDTGERCNKPYKVVMLVDDQVIESVSSTANATTGCANSGNSTDFQVISFSPSIDLRNYTSAQVYIDNSENVNDIVCRYVMHFDSNLNYAYVAAPMTELDLVSPSVEQYDCNSLQYVFHDDEGYIPNLVEHIVEEGSGEWIELIHLYQTQGDTIEITDYNFTITSNAACMSSYTLNITYTNDTDHDFSMNSNSLDNNCQHYGSGAIQANMTDLSSPINLLYGDFIAKVYFFTMPTDCIVHMQFLFNYNNVTDITSTTTTEESTTETTTTEETSTTETTTTEEASTTDGTDIDGGAETTTTSLDDAALTSSWLAASGYTPSAGSEQNVANAAAGIAAAIAAMLA